jgi:hypothetical protein
VIVEIKTAIGIAIEAFRGSAGLPGAARLAKLARPEAQQTLNDGDSNE